MRANRLRSLLDEGRPSLGTHITSTWPTIVELVGRTRAFDYVEFIAEYAPWTLHDLENLARAIELSPDFAGLVKVEQGLRASLTMHATGAGLQNVVFADIRTAADAVECIRWARPEHPSYGGLLGSGMRRDVGVVGGSASAEWVKAQGECVVIIMIEKKEALENLSEILSVDGVDMVAVGRNDLAMSMGWDPASHQRDIMALEAQVIDAAQEKGVPVRIDLWSAGEADHYISRGVRHFCLGWDVLILHDWWRGEGSTVQKMLSEVGPV